MISYQGMLNGIKKAVNYGSLIVIPILAAACGGNGDSNPTQTTMPTGVHRPVSTVTVNRSTLDTLVTGTPSSENINEQEIEVPASTSIFYPTNTPASVPTPTSTPEPKSNLVFDKPEEMGFDFRNGVAYFGPVRITNDGESNIGSTVADVYLDNERKLSYAVRKEDGSYNLNPRDIAEQDVYLGIIKRGKHNLRIEIDPKNSVAETNEEDNTFEREFYWDPKKGVITKEQFEALPNLTLYDPEQLKEGLLQIVNDGKIPVEAAGPGYWLFTFSIRTDDENRFSSAVRNKEDWREVADMLEPGEVTERDINFTNILKETGKYRVSIDPGCMVTESTRSDNNYELDVKISEDGTKEVNVTPLVLTEYEHCTQRYSWPKHHRKSTRFDDWKEKDEIELARTVDINGNVVNFWIHKGENTASGYFEDNSIDPDELLDRVQEVFSKTIPYTDGVTGMSLPEYNIVLTSEIQDGSSAEAFLHTNVIGIKPELFSESTLEGNVNEHMPTLSAAHEDYHLRNFLTDPTENVFGLEYSAIIHEAGAIVNVFDRKKLEEGLEKEIAHIKNFGIDLLDLSDQDVRRALAYDTALRVLDSRGLHTLEDLAEQLLRDPAKGITSFDRVANIMDLGFTFWDVWLDFKDKNGL